MSDPLSDAAMTLVQQYATSKGVSVDVEGLVRMAGQVLQATAEVFDGRAKRQAEAAGAERAAGVTDMESAERAAKARDP